MKRSLFPERDDPNNESHAKTACTPSMNYDRGHWNNTSETNNTTNNSLNRDIFSNIFSSNTGKSSYFNNDFARQSSLSPESDYPNSKSHSKSVCVSPMNDDNGQWNNTSERSHITNKHVYRYIFSKINYSKSGEFSYSNNDFTMNCSLFPERDYPDSESHSQNSGISAMNDHQGQSDIMSETKSTTNDADSETIIVYDPVPSTSSKNQSQHVRKLDGSANDTFEDLASTSNQPDSTDDMNGLPSSNQGPSAENYVQERIYDDIPRRIDDIISEMKSNPLDINDLDNHTKKIRILSNIATTLNILVSDLKMELRVIKRRFERNPESDKQFITKLESIIDKWDVSNISEVIPDRIKAIISEMKTGALGVNELETFFKQTKKKKNLSNVTKWLNIDLDCLKKQLIEIKRVYDKNPERGNKEVNQFMKRLERIINRLDDPLQVNPKRINEIISEIKNGAVGMNELEAFVNQAKNRKNLNNVSESSNIDVRLLEEAAERYKKEVGQES
ncbi:hypothetical protein AVEN_147452-1 [Araneus ventricosus]|uniref:Uncharacterized protein n=1 Tax=Araneus ventricosus TaxID=182803 RepID=A0A4Y2TT76_ARAVE|nr:hypothetical protein AVEN_147452-1 [Araneus ventricosus]